MKRLSSFALIFILLLSNIVIAPEEVTSQKTELGLIIVEAPSDIAVSYENGLLKVGSNAIAGIDESIPAKFTFAADKLIFADFTANGLVKEYNFGSQNLNAQKGTHIFYDLATNIIDLENAPSQKLDDGSEINSNNNFYSFELFNEKISAVTIDQGTYKNQNNQISIESDKSFVIRLDGKDLEDERGVSLILGEKITDIQAQNTEGNLKINIGEGLDKVTFDLKENTNLAFVRAEGIDKLDIIEGETAISLNDQRLFDFGEEGIKNFELNSYEHFKSLQEQNKLRKNIFIGQSETGNFILDEQYNVAITEEPIDKNELTLSISERRINNRLTAGKSTIDEELSYAESLAEKNKGTSIESKSKLALANLYAAKAASIEKGFTEGIITLEGEARPLKYKLKNIGGKIIVEQWSPDGKNWMSLTETKVKGGVFNGQEPTEENKILLSNLARSNGDYGVLSIEASKRAKNGGGLIGEVPQPSENYLLAEENYQKAVSIYEELKKDLPTEARFSLAQLHLQRGSDLGNFGSVEYAKAFDIFKEANEIAESQNEKSSALLGMSISSANLGDLERALQYNSQVLKADPNNAEAKSLLLNYQKGILKAVDQALASEKDFNLDKKLGLEDYEGTVVDNLAQVFGNTGRLIAGRGYAADLAVVYKGVQSQLTRQQTGNALLRIANDQGITIQEVAAINDKGPLESQKFVQEILGIRENYDSLSETDKKRIDFFRDGLAEVLTNPDIKLAIQNGQLTREQTKQLQSALSRGEVAWHGLSYNEAPELNSLVPDKFNFKTGRGYIDKGSLEYTWRDYVFEGADLKNAAIFLVPGAQFGRLANIGAVSRLGITAETRVAGALLGGLARAAELSVGAEKGALAARFATFNTGLSTSATGRIFNANILPTRLQGTIADRLLTSTSGFLGEEAIEEGVGTIVGALTGSAELGLLGEMTASFGGSSKAKVTETLLNSLEGIEDAASTTAKKIEIDIPKTTELAVIQGTGETVGKLEFNDINQRRQFLSAEGIQEVGTARLIKSNGEEITIPVYELNGRQFLPVVKGEELTLTHLNGRTADIFSSTDTRYANSVVRVEEKIIENRGVPETFPKARVETERIIENTGLSAERIDDLTGSSGKLYHDTTHSLGDNSETAGVAELANQLAVRKGLSDERVRTVTTSAAFHDFEPTSNRIRITETGEEALAAPQVYDTKQFQADLITLGDQARPRGRTLEWLSSQEGQQAVFNSVTKQDSRYKLIQQSDLALEQKQELTDLLHVANMRRAEVHILGTHFPPDNTLIKAMDLKVNDLGNSLTTFNRKCGELCTPELAQQLQRNVNQELKNTLEESIIITKADQSQPYAGSPPTSSFNRIKGLNAETLAGGGTIPPRGLGTGTRDFVFGDPGFVSRKSGVLGPENVNHIVEVAKRNGLEVKAPETEEFLELLDTKQLANLRSNAVLWETFQKGELNEATALANAESLRRNLIRATGGTLPEPEILVQTEVPESAAAKLILERQEVVLGSGLGGAAGLLERTKNVWNRFVIKRAHGGVVDAADNLRIARETGKNVEEAEEAFRKSSIGYVETVNRKVPGGDLEVAHRTALNDVDAIKNRYLSVGEGDTLIGGKDVSFEEKLISVGEGDTLIGGKDVSFEEKLISVGEGDTEQAIKISDNLNLRGRLARFYQKDIELRDRLKVERDALRNWELSIDEIKGIEQDLTRRLGRSPTDKEFSLVLENHIIATKFREEPAALTDFEILKLKEFAKKNIRGQLTNEEFSELTQEYYRIKSELRRNTILPGDTIEPTWVLSRKEFIEIDHKLTKELGREPTHKEFSDSAKEYFKSKVSEAEIELEEITPGTGRIGESTVGNLPTTRVDDLEDTVSFGETAEIQAEDTLSGLETLVDVPRSEAVVAGNGLAGAAQFLEGEVKLFTTRRSARALSDQYLEVLEAKATGQDVEAATQEFIETAKLHLKKAESSSPTALNQASESVRVMTKTIQDGTADDARRVLELLATNKQDTRAINALTRISELESEKFVPSPKYARFLDKTGDIKPSIAIIPEQAQAKADQIGQLLEQIQGNPGRAEAALRAGDISRRAGITLSKETSGEEVIARLELAKRSHLIEKTRLEGIRTSHQDSYDYLVNQRGLPPEEATRFIIKGEGSQTVPEPLTITRSGEAPLREAIEKDEVKFDTLRRRLVSPQESLDEIIAGIPSEATSVSFIRRNGINPEDSLFTFRNEGGEFVVDHTSLRSPSSTELNSRINTALGQLRKAETLEGKLIDLEKQISLGKQQKIDINSLLEERKIAQRELGITLRGKEGYRELTTGGENVLTDSILINKEHLEEVRKAVELIGNDIRTNDPSHIILSGRGGFPYEPSFREQVPDSKIIRVTTSVGTRVEGNRYFRLDQTLDEIIETPTSEPVKLSLMEGAEYSGSSVKSLKDHLRNKLQSIGNENQIEVTVYTIAQGETASRLGRVGNIEEVSVERLGIHKIRHVRVPVRFVLGEDAAITLGQLTTGIKFNSNVPIVIFDNNGRIVQTITPRTTTTEEFSKLIAQH
ncbi:MAG: tetratricopeptide repeat protein [Candidatus Woesearchaeota archaeon]|nr:MAG: tetratricopeptide repeat protein [Candidatus Woesearchaeota archaeon]